MGDEFDAIGADCHGDVGDGSDHPFGDATVVTVGRRHDRRSDDRHAGQIDSDGLSERAADVDAHPQHRGHDATVAGCNVRPGRRAKRGLTANAYAAPHRYTDVSAPWATNDGSVGQIPVASARKIGRRGSVVRR